MIHMGDGVWVKELSLPPGNYEYRMVVDGEWIPDPWTDNYVPNPFGGINSVLKVSTQSPPQRAGNCTRRPNTSLGARYEIPRLQ